MERIRRGWLEIKSHDRYILVREMRNPDAHIRETRRSDAHIGEMSLNAVIDFRVTGLEWVAGESHEGSVCCYVR